MEIKITGLSILLLIQFIILTGIIFMNPIYTLMWQQDFILILTH